MSYSRIPKKVREQRRAIALYLIRDEAYMAELRRQEQAFGPDVLTYEERKILAKAQELQAGGRA